MHGLVFLPAAVFCAVGAISWIIMAAIDRLESLVDRRRQQAAPVRGAVRLVLIEGGLKTRPAATPLPFRQAQRPLPSGAMVAPNAAIAYGALLRGSR